MHYALKIKASAQKDLLQLPHKARQRVINAIDALAENPQRGSVLKGELRGLYRLRVGDYRIIYEIQHEAVVVLVLRVDHRREVYRSQQ